MLKPEQPNLVEIQIREEIRAELLDEQDAEKLQESMANRDRRLIAFAISMTLSVSVVLPLVALIVGVSWRAFRWASGL